MTRPDEDWTSLMTSAVPTRPADVGVTGPELRAEASRRREHHRHRAFTAVAVAAAVIAVLTVALADAVRSTPTRSQAAVDATQSTSASPTASNLGSFHPVGPPQRWSSIHTTDNPRILLIDEYQSSFDPHSYCWVHAEGTSVYRNGVFFVTVREGDVPGEQPRPHRTVCALNAVNVPSYATVHLPVPYTGQPIVDAATGRVHRPLSRVPLSEAPKKYR